MNDILTAEMVDAGKKGHCNFCTRPKTKVWIVRSRDENRHLVVLVCPECLKELKEATG